MPVTGLRTTNLKVQVRNFGSFEELQFLDKYMLNWQSLQSAEICFNALFIVLNYDYFKKAASLLAQDQAANWLNY